MIYLKTSYIIYTYNVNTRRSHTHIHTHTHTHTHTYTHNLTLGESVVDIHIVLLERPRMMDGGSYIV